jgi:8-oxo-dGTP diphosphatase
MEKGIDFTGIAVVYLCHDGNGHILLNKRGLNTRDEQGKWDGGGGALELGGTVEETLRKEIKEEYSADILDFQFLGYRDVHREHDDKKTYWVALDFVVRVDRQKVKNGEPHKFDEVGWFTLDNMPSPLHSGFAKFLEKNKEGLSLIFSS